MDVSPSPARATKNCVAWNFHPPVTGRRHLDRHSLRTRDRQEDSILWGRAESYQNDPCPLRRHWLRAMSDFIPKRTLCCRSLGALRRSFLSRSSIPARIKGRERLMLSFFGCVLFVVVLTATGLTAQEAAETSDGASVANKAEASRQTQQSVCLLLESAAHANGLPVEFFVRLIWRESRFRPTAVGPSTRSGKHALGIAQFMPATAAERNLLDPFNPIEALPKAAEFLKELRDQFGNLGLAAAAYNAGPGRVQAWMAGAASLPAQTRAYVEAVTGNSVDQWAAGRDLESKSDIGVSCETLMAKLKQPPTTFMAALQQHIVSGVIQPWGAILGADRTRP